MISRGKLYLLTFAVGAAFSLIRYWQDPILNYDGVLYAHLAREILVGGAARGLFDLNFYPHLIALVSGTFFGGNVLTGAIALNVALNGLIGLAFVRLCAAVGMRQSMLWLAAFAVLSHELLIDYRSYFIRDFGYWAFGMLAVSEIVLFSRDRQSFRILLWPFWLLLGTLFRYEGLLLVFASAGLLWARGGLSAASVLLCLRFNAMLLVGAMIAGSLILLGSSGNALILLLGSLERFSEMLEVGKFAEIAREFESIVMPQGRDESSFILAAGFIALVPKKLLAAMTLPFLLLSLFVVRRRNFKELYGGWVLTIALIAALAGLAGFALQMGFLTTRYAMFAALLLMVVVTFCAAVVFEAGGRRTRLAIPALLFIGLLDGFVSTSDSQANEVEAIAWAATELPATASLASNRPQLAMQPMRSYNHRLNTALNRIAGPQPFLTERGLRLWPTSDYLLMSFDDEDRDYRGKMESTGRLELVREFHSSDGDYVVVYRVLGEVDDN